METGWKIIEPILGAFFNILDKVCKIVKDICKWWQTMINKIKNGSITGTVLNLVEKSKKITKIIHMLEQRLVILVKLIQVRKVIMHLD